MAKNDNQSIVKKALKDALGGGLPGAFAMTVQVTTLMWLRTTVNYQYRYGTSTKQAFITLYKDGGIRRFYRGYFPALFQAPLSRFGDTAANAGVLSYFNSNESTKNIPTVIKTVVASLAAAAFRTVLMPIDTFKTILQVEGKNGMPLLRQKLKDGGPKVLFNGAIGASSATFVGHYPWFATYNLLDENLEKQTVLYKKLLRSAFIGFCSSFISDCSANWIRVIKTTKQTKQGNESYLQITRQLIKEEGVIGLATRGLTTKIIANGLQGLMFSVAWRILQDAYQKHFK